MTHQYTIATGGIVLGAGGPPDTPRTAIAWAADRVLAVGSDIEVRAISRGDSTFLDLAGSIVTPTPRDEAAAERVVQAAIAVGDRLDPVEAMWGAGLLADGGRLEPGSPADLAFWGMSSRRVPPAAAAATVRIIATVRAGAFTAGDAHTGPFARLPGWTAPARPPDEVSRPLP